MFCSSLFAPSLANHTHNLVAVVFYIVAAVFITAINLILAYGIYKYRQWKLRSTRLFVVILFPDLMVGLFTCPLITSYLIKPSINHCFYINFVSFFAIFPSLLSALTLLMISADRYFAVIRKSLHVKYATVTVITFAILFDTFMALIWPLIPYYLLQDNNHGQAIAVISLGIFKLFIIVGVIIVYRSIWKAVKHTAQRTRQSIASENGSVNRYYDQSLQKMSLIVSVSLVICFLPSCIANFYIAYCKLANNIDQALFHYIEIWTLLLMYLNSGINGTFTLQNNKRLRRWFRKIFFKTPFRLNREECNPSTIERRHAMVLDNDTHRSISRLALNAESEKLS